ncbi:type I restriction enzyme M protein [Streptomyces sp. CG 926]|uniref:N-6 DNA methylase n=1 Tax=Streptomyces sp. CG 926 TaxID=1882405 RepID=UPI000D6ADEE7|nr:N-6 DNA methylase [Streptomyces sp. CG 926]PWK70319.1 type I restriction enzyme M protein [Streptomyces sp. CG 926]
MDANAAQEAALRRAVDALRGVVPVEEALRLVMLLGLLRHQAESSRSTDELYSASRSYAWDEVRSGVDGDHLHEVIARGVRDWQMDRGHRVDLPVPDLHALRGARVYDVVGVVAQAPSPVRLFDLVLQAQSREAKGGHYFTPSGVARLMVELLDPREGDSVHDPACGSGGLLIESAAHVAARGGAAGRLRLFGQDVSASALATAEMNIGIRDLDALLVGTESSLLRDGFPDRTFDVVAVNPPFNMSRWDGGYGRHDEHWPLGVPPQGNANFAWVQVCLKKLAPGGKAGILLPTGAATGTRGAERDIRAHLVDQGLLTAVVELPAGIIPHVRNPMCLWIMSGFRGAGPVRQPGEVLLVDARETAVTVDKRQRILPGEAIGRISDTFASWLGRSGARSYADRPGWCRSVPLVELAAQEHDVLPSRHVPAQGIDETDFGGHRQLSDLTAELEHHFDESNRLERELRHMLGIR